jgi:CRP-like cAMP-binding protein
MHEGLPGEGVLVLLAGIVKATCVTRAGHEAILAFRGPGELIGELALIDHRPHSSTVVAIEPVDALIVPARDFRAFLEERPAAAVALMRMVVDRFRDTDRKLVEFTASDALARVASRLLELAETHGAVPLSQEELAGWAGCSVKAVVNALQTLRRLGLVETARRQITILDLEGLQARAPIP